MTTYRNLGGVSYLKVVFDLAKLAKHNRESLGKLIALLTVNLHYRISVFFSRDRKEADARHICRIALPPPAVLAVLPVC